MKWVEAVLILLSEGARTGSGKRRSRIMGGGPPHLRPPMFEPSAHGLPAGLSFRLTMREASQLEPPPLQQRRERPALRERGKLSRIRVKHLVFGQTDRERHVRNVESKFVFEVE